jgi:PiT family inorganic phosphate transporter
MLTTLIFLTSGLFLGWSLGANDAANVWGTAVGTGMVRFRRAAAICSIFVVAGAVISGRGASETIGRLGAIGTLAGAFTVALAAALTVYWMTKAGLPVSTTQAIVGAIVGWSLYSATTVDIGSLTKILATWVSSPVLTAVLSFALYHLARLIVGRSRIHLIRLDGWTRALLIAAGAFGSYSLGANNIANVMGVFVESTREIFVDVRLGGFGSITGVQQLFLLGGISISVGVFTYSKKVMLTVGSDIYKLSPIAALVVVLSSAVVLYLFASQGLKDFLVARNLPSLPLVPVSSSQSIVGGVVGVGLARRGRNLNLKILRRIGLGWVATPLISAMVAFAALFVMEKGFGQAVV